MRAAAFVFAAALIAVAPASAQTADPFLDLASELSSSIAAAVPAGTPVRLSFVKDDERLRSEVSRALAARGVRVVESDDAISVTASCGINLRERVCAAQIGTGDARRVVVATRPLDAKAPATLEPIVGIELRPLYAQREPMLDAAAAGNQLLVLTPDSVALVGEPGGAAAPAHPAASQPIRTGRVWPRDIRGMLETSGATFSAHLPGVTCRGTIVPFTVTCADESDAWPIGIENGGIAASRNTFATPEGLTFYEAAAFDDRRWLVVNEQGVLTWLDARRRVVARGDASDHVAAFRDPCGGDGAYVVTAARSGETNAEMLRLWRAAGMHLVPAASTVALPGVLTSLWAAPAARSATAIVHDVNAGRYEAVHITLSCAR